MSVFKVCGAVLSVVLLSACAASQSDNGAVKSAKAAAEAGGVASSLNINVTNTIVRVAELNDKGLLRAELEEFKEGLYWTRGLRPTDAVIEITGERELDGVSGSTAESTGFGQSELFGTVALVDAATGDVVIEPIFVTATVGSNRDARTIGLTTGTKPGVELEYLVQKFILAGREALYGVGN